MCTDKSIKVLVNGEEKHKIEAENRSISAEAIYKMIGFSAGDHYIVSSENEANVDSQVLELFTGLLNDVANKVNAMQVGGMAQKLLLLNSVDNCFKPKWQYFGNTNLFLCEQHGIDLKEAGGGREMSQINFYD